VLANICKHHLNLQHITEKGLKYLFSLSILLIFASCSTVEVYDQWKNLDDNTWDKKKNIQIPLQISDTDHYYNLGINLRITNDYKYTNLWVKLNTTDPAGKKSSELLNLALADHRGYWSGHNLGHIISFRLLAQKNKVFNKPGEYKFEFQQYMRDTLLKEVVSIGIKLDKQQEILK
jgi:gliding motility-associated lipoprotein GldH